MRVPAQRSWRAGSPKPKRDKALASSPPARESDTIEPMTADDTASLIADLGDIAAALQEAEPEDKLDLDGART